MSPKSNRQHHHFLRLERLENRDLMAVDLVQPPDQSLVEVVEVVPSYELSTPAVAKSLNASTNGFALNSRLDINGDGHVSPLDLLAIINHLNEPPASGSETSGFEPNSPLDINGDGHVSPLDLLVILNHLNEPPASGSALGEGDGPSAANPIDVNRSGNVDSQDALALFAFLKQHGSVRLSEQPIGLQRDYSTFDVDGNDWISPADALLVVNELHRLESRTPSLTAKSVRRQQQEFANSVDRLLADDSYSSDLA